MLRGLLLVAALASCTPSSSAGDGGIAESCADVAAPACFSNADCAAGLRCATPANADPMVYVVCCLPGARGTAQAGAPCPGGFDDCATAVCAYTPSGPVCSGSCQSDGDCPAALPSCVTVDAGSRFCGLALP